MSRIFVAALAAALLFSAGCVVPSLAPLYTDTTLAYDPALIGVWIDGENGTSYTFSPLEGQAYYLDRLTKDGDAAAFICHLVELGGKRFLDVYPAEPQQSIAGYMLWEFMPAHSFFMVEQVESYVPQTAPQLRFTTLNPIWLQEYVEEYPGAVQLGSIDLGDGDSLPVFTGTTAELQDLLPKLIALQDSAYGETFLAKQP